MCKVQTEEEEFGPEKQGVGKAETQLLSEILVELSRDEVKWIEFIFLAEFLRKGLVYPWLVWNLLCRSQWP